MMPGTNIDGVEPQPLHLSIHDFYMAGPLRGSEMFRITGKCLSLNMSDSLAKSGLLTQHHWWRYGKHKSKQIQRRETHSMVLWITCCWVDRVWIMDHELHVLWPLSLSLRDFITCHNHPHFVCVLSHDYQIITSIICICAHTCNIPQN